jgi:hypothetical protein
MSSRRCPSLDPRVIIPSGTAPLYPEVERDAKSLDIIGVMRAEVARPCSPFVGVDDIGRAEWPVCAPLHSSLSASAPTPPFVLRRQRSKSASNAMIVAATPPIAPPTISGRWVFFDPRSLELVVVGLEMADVVVKSESKLM